MNLGVRIIAVSVAVSLLVGPWVPIVGAQQPAQQPQPDIFQEALQRHQGDQASGTMPGAESPSDEGRVIRHGIAAGFATLFLVPGRTITCAMGTGVFFALLALSGGTGYRWATAALDEGCGGKWVVKPEDLEGRASMPGVGSQQR